MLKKFIKPLLKKFVKSTFGIWIISRLVALYIKIIFYTIKWDENQLLKIRQYNSQSVILVFWHGRMLMMPKIWNMPKLTNVMISIHSDGELIAKSIEALGYKTIRGSTGKGGAAAFRKALKILKSESIAITPDGPRGPRNKINGYLLDIAAISGRPILFVNYSVAKSKIAKSWDAMLVPKAFSHGAVLCSDPIYVTKDNKEQLLIDLEAQFNQITDKADQMVGMK